MLGFWIGAQLSSALQFTGQTNVALTRVTLSLSQTERSEFEPVESTTVSQSYGLPMPIGHR